MTEPSPSVITLPREAAENGPIYRAKAHPMRHEPEAGRKHRRFTMTELERALLWILVCYEGMKLFMKLVTFFVL
jgi:hypothetical protein